MAGLPEKTIETSSGVRLFKGTNAKVEHSIKLENYPKSRSGMVAWALPAKQNEFIVPCVELHRLQEEH